MIGWLLALAVAFVVLLGPVIWLVTPFVAQILDDARRDDSWAAKVARFNDVGDA